MWFGTQDGLNRFDGYRFTAYKNVPGDSTSLNWNYIRCFYEDASERVLWIGTANGGFNKLDLPSEQFKHFTQDPRTPNSLSHNDVWSLLRDRSGKLWVGTADGLNQFDPVEEKFTIHKNKPDNPSSLSGDFVKIIYEDRSGTLWIGTDNGLNRVNRTQRHPLNFDRFQHDPNKPNSLSHSNVKSIYEDHSGALWVGTLDGLNRFESDRKGFVRYQNNPDDRNSLSDNDIQAIYEDRQGTLWIGTYGGGLNRFDRDTEIFTHYRNAPDDPSSLSHNNVKSIYEDRSGVLWIGTFNDGLNKLDLQTKKFGHTQKQPGNPNSLNSNDVRSIYEDRSGVLWIGTDYDGLNKFDRESNRFTHYRHDPANQSSLSHNSAFAIQEDQFGMLWIGTDSGLNRLDPKTETFTHYKHEPDNPASLSSNHLIVLFEDRAGVLWVGTNTNGLNRFDRNSETFTHYTKQENNPRSLSHNSVRSIYEDRAGVLWIGTDGGGLNRFDRDTEKFTCHKNEANNLNSLSNNVVFSIHEDRWGMLWIGTLSGLNRFDRSTKTFVHYREEDGLPNDVIYGILEDDVGDLWVSTNNGLSKLALGNIQGQGETAAQGTAMFRNFDIHDGVQGIEFNSGAYHKSRSGEMFFGGNKGFNRFYPERIQDNPYLPQIVITDFQIFNKSVPFGKNAQTHGRAHLQRHVSETGEITLSYKENVFSFEFAALHYATPERNQYAYRMEGFDDGWTYVGNQRKATYTNLDPGEYAFKVKGSNNDQLWNEKGRSIRVIITPPFWKTLWFRIFLTLFVLTVALTWHKRRIRTIESKKKDLESRVKQKTEAAEALQNALSEVERLKNRLEVENIYLQNEIKLAHNFSDIIGGSTALKKTLHKVEQVASADATVLILGESGTGKELLARAVHNLSPRRDRPLVKVNCAALPANLIESELFGHEKGAFTGALARKIGRFELADSGTVFLDEIGDLSLELQTKLLRVLQEGEIERVGSSKTITVDVRVIAATNRNLKKALAKGEFREDLFYRLNVFPITSPPLRERKEDIPLLVNHFIRKYSGKAGKKIESVSQHIMATLQRYDWPGNVRELENIIERAVIVSHNSQLKLENWLTNEDTGKAGTAALFTLEENERQHIIRALNLTDWRISGEKGAAKLLGINHKTLYSRMQKLGINKKQI